MKSIRIGNAGGYWGDDPDALARQVTGGPLDFITIDYLAEITMSIMNKQRSRDPEAGYATDFLRHLKPVFREVMDRGIRIITNAGGVNPEALARRLMELAEEMGLSPTIAVVDGDNILDDLERLADEGVDFSNMETGVSFDTIRGRVLSANLYFGALPVVHALQAGADIVITGRVTDTGITLAPMIAELGWSWDDYDRLAAGIVAGHILECGAQSTGGNFTDWEQVPAFTDMGYPIAQVYEDGTFVITKHDRLDGMVSVDTVREQLLYEMGDPTHYITPDVIADFTTIRLSKDGPNRVRVSGVKGSRPTDLLKVSMAYADGYKAEGAVIISGPDAVRKAEVFRDIFWSRVGTDFEDHLTELVGHTACHRHLSRLDDSNEVLLRFAVRDHDRDKFERFRRKLPALILSGPPAVAVTGGAPRVQNVVSYWPALVPQEISTWRVRLFRHGEGIGETTGGWPGTGGQVSETDRPEPSWDAMAGMPTRRLPLKAVALARSGDKGDTANVGIMARSETAYRWLGAVLTPETVKAMYGELVKGDVVRYPVPNLRALNFLLQESLGGGGTMSLRIDAQGKTLAHALLAQPFDIPEPVLASVEADRG